MLELYEKNLLDLGVMADNIRKEKWQKKLFFNSNIHVNPTNVCKDVCKFCAFSASRKNPNPYSMTTEQIISKIDGVKNEITEVHIVGAHNPDMGLSFYLPLFREIKKLFPHTRQGFDGGRGSFFVGA